MSRWGMIPAPEEEAPDCICADSGYAWYPCKEHDDCMQHYKPQASTIKNDFHHVSNFSQFKAASQLKKYLEMAL